MCLVKAFSENRRPAARRPVARWTWQTSLILQAHPTLTDQDMGDTCGAVDVMPTASIG